MSNNTITFIYLDHMLAKEVLHITYLMAKFTFVKHLLALSDYYYVLV